MIIAKILWRVDDKDIVEENGEKVIRIPEGVDEIEEGAFTDMKSAVERVIIPRSAYIYDNSAFKGLDTYALVFEGSIDAETTGLHAGALDGIKGLGYLVVPNEQAKEDIDYIRSEIFPNVITRDEFDKVRASDGMGGK